MKHHDSLSEGGSSNTSSTTPIKSCEREKHPTYPMGHVGLYASSQLELAVGMLQLHLAENALRCYALIGLRAR